jgi:hypothetical protein
MLATILAQPVIFTDLTAPTTVAALLLEGLLVVLAVGMLAAPVLVPAGRRLARALAVVGFVWSLGMAVGLLGEAWTSDPPLTVPGAPLGTFTQPTQLGLLAFALAQLFILVGAILPFRRSGLAGLLFLA